MIPYGKQAIDQADIDAVVAVLQSDYLTQGPQVPAFEKAMAQYCQANYAVAVNSATSALHIACLALGLGDGDWLWTSPNTFVASANCAHYCGAQVDFVDINARTYNMCADALERKLIQAQLTNCLPKIVIPVHFAGQACDMQRIHQLSQQYGFHIIEDASHAIGGKYFDKPIGGCQFSDITVFSFHPVKIITTAEGGLATTNKSDLAEKMQLFRSHGVTREPHLMTHAIEGPWYYQQVDLGFNYRMTELQAALGLSQLNKLDQFVSQRHQIAQLYQKQLVGLPIVLPYQQPNCYSSLHLFPIQVKASQRAELFEQMRAKDLGVNVHYIPVHTQPYYQRLGFKIGDFPNAEAYYQRAISIPLYQAMTTDQQSFVVDVLDDLLGKESF